MRNSGVFTALDHRICPGKHLAFQTLPLNIACTVVVFDSLAPVGEKLEAKYSKGFIRCVAISNSYFPLLCSLRKLTG